MGSEATKNEWLGEQLTIWTKAVEDLAVISEKYPQTVHMLGSLFACRISGSMSSEL